MSTLLDIEKRLQKALLYKQLCYLELKVLGDTDTAKEVYEEIQAFAMARLESLLGFKEEPGPSKKETATKTNPPAAPPSVQHVQSNVVQDTDVGPGDNQENSPKQESGETPPAEMFVLNPDSESPITFTKTGMRHPKTNEFIWSGPNNGKFVMAVNSVGGRYMKSVNVPTMPIGIKPLQALNEDAMAITASRHLAAAKKANPLAASLTEE